MEYRPVRRTFVTGFGLITLLAASGLAAQQPISTTRPVPSLRERAEMSRAKGAQNAPVLVYEIADFQCPYCARFVKEVFPKLDAEYVKTGKVKWVFVNLPLPSHTHGWAAAEAALCAGSTNERSFWAMHDKLFATQDEWGVAPDPTPHFIAYAKEAGVPLEPFQACMAKDAVARLIIEDVIAAAASQVTGTPTFVIDNQEMVVGLKSVEEWREILDRALKKK